MTSLKNQQGYTLIITVVIISTVLLLIAVVSARGVQNNVAFSVEFDRFLQAQALAEACSEVALLNRTIDDTYSGNETITIGSNSCEIHNVTSSTIDVSALVDDIPYRVSIEHSDNLIDILVDKWERVE